MKANIIDIEYLNRRLIYNPESGDVLWRHGKKSGTQCGWNNGRYYVCLLDKKRFCIHRIAWAIFYKKFPDNLIDHIDGNGFNNKISNLREADKSKNGINRGMEKGNKTGFKGVSIANRVKGKKYLAQINHKGKHYFLGYHSTPEIAHQAYCKKGSELFGDFFKSM
jgi:hypothetical protein